MKSALVIGASRGIGRQICLTLARNGFAIGVASKTTENSDRLPGTIYSVAEEINKLGAKALPLICNVRNDEDISNSVSKCIAEFGSLDFLVYNAGSITWDKVLNTPLKRYDLMNDVNVRGAYAAVQVAAPHMLNKKKGKILLISPPIYSRFFNGKTSYAITKVGMTVLVHGFAQEIQNTGVSITALWPATAIESHVTTKIQVPGKFMRKPDIMADACLRIAEDEPESVNGRALIDEDYLRQHGVTDFNMYRCEADHEPPRMMPADFPDLSVKEQNWNSPWTAKL